MTQRPPWRVIEGGWQPPPEPPAHLPVDLIQHIADWFFSELDGVSGLDHGELLRRRAQSLVALNEELTEGLRAGLSASRARRGDVTAFMEAARGAHAALSRRLADSNDP